MGNLKLSHIKIKRLYRLIYLSLMCACASPASTHGMAFSAENNILSAGDCTLLIWKVQGSQRVTLDGEKVDPVGQLRVCPQTTSTYFLYADFGTDEDFRQISIQVNHRGDSQADSSSGVSIQFWADRTEINPGECTFVHWRTQGGPVRINGIELDANGDDSTCPQETREFVLVVGNDLATNTIVVKVNPAEVNASQTEISPAPAEKIIQSKPTTDTKLVPVPKLPSAPDMLPTTYGRITKDETWQGEVRLVGDIIIEEGVTLTIKPGTTILIAANQDVNNLLDDPFDLKIGIAQEDHIDKGIHLGEPFRDEANHISIIVLGKLIAVGTPDKKITFTSSSSTPTIYDWNKLRIDNGKVAYALIEYYRALDMGHNVEITNSELRHIGECGVCTYGPGLLKENHLWDAGHELIGSQGTPKIINNLFGPFPIRFAIILGGGSPIIRENTFENCGGAVYIIAPSTPTIEDNIYINTPHKIGYP